MKIFALALAFLLAMGMTVSAQTSESITLRAGQQRTASKSGLKIKFISVIEDSRCPEGVDCIWAGNAKIKVQIVGRQSSKVFEFNTTTGPKGDILDGWSIVVDALTPVPKADRKISPKLYTVKLKINRLQR